MRCISPYKNYSITLFSPEEEIVEDSRGFGRSRIVHKAVTADFEQSGILDHEVEQALSSFTFSMLPEGVNPLSRISVFDTEAYALSLPKQGRDERLAQIEERLRELQEQFPTDFIIVETPKAQKPWGSYDEDDVEDILKFQERLDLSPTLVRRYEQENENREEIVERMLQLESGVAAAKAATKDDTIAEVKA